MKIKKIKMVDYKRFKNLTIDLGDNPKKIIALVGKNGCGKSSVLDGILYKLNEYLGKVGNGSYKDFNYHSLSRFHGYNSNFIEIVFNEGEYSSIMSNLSNSGRIKSIVNFRSSFRHNNQLDIKSTVAIEDIMLNNYGSSNASELDMRIDQNYQRLLSRYNEYRDNNDIKPSEAKEIIIGELNKSINNCLDLRITSLGDIQSGRGKLYFSKSDSDIEFDFNVLSAGEKEVIDILLDLYLRRDVYNDSIYIIDEPELHISTAIQKRLLLEINKLIPLNCQLWIATHSLGFLRSLKEDLRDDSQIIYFDEANKWASQSYVLYPQVPNRKLWESIFSIAIDDLSSLISPQKIIYCEGKAEPGKSGEEKGLDAIVLNTIFSKKFPDYVFVSSGGNTELDQRSSIAFSILSKVFKNIEIILLKDRDMASGKTTSEDIRQQYLNSNPSSHRVLKRFEIENYLFDKIVLQEYCNKNGYNFDETSYDKQILDIYNDNVKDKIGIIKNFCDIKVSINPDIFKKQLAECIVEGSVVYNELFDVIFNRA